MRKYYLTVIGPNTSWQEIIEAEYFSNSTGGSYYFYSNKEIVACYPIHRTVIHKIEKLDNTPLTRYIESFDDDTLI